MTLGELIKSAEQGNPEAQNNLGVCYVTGEGVDQDFSKAVMWFTKAVEHGELPALVNLGICFAEGNGVEKNLTKAIELFIQAANYGIENSDRYLLSQIGIDEVKKYAEQGNAQAQYYLGICYGEGKGVEPNVTETLKWFEKATEQSDPFIYNKLGLCFANGYCVPRNLAKSEEMFLKAIELGYDAQHNLAIVRTKIAEEKDLNPYFLVKLLKKEYANRLLDGEVFMRSMSCFWDLSKGDGDVKNTSREDTLEGLSGSFARGDDFHFFREAFDNNTLSQFEGTGVIDDLLARELIYCLYSLEYDLAKKQFIKPDSQLLDFGDTAVVIFDSNEFLKRICKNMLVQYGDDFWISFKRVKYDINQVISKLLIKYLAK